MDIDKPLSLDFSNEKNRIDKVKISISDVKSEQMHVQFFTIKQLLSRLLTIHFESRYINLGDMMVGSSPSVDV